MYKNIKVCCICSIYVIDVFCIHLSQGMYFVYTFLKVTDAIDVLYIQHI